MRGVVLHGPGDLRIEQLPIPEPKNGELLLRVETAGVCGSDLAELDHGPVLTPLRETHPDTGHAGPIVLGHEFSGVVENSFSDDFDKGDLVACAAAVTCGTCRYCATGRKSLCEHYWAVGLHRNGGLAEFCSVPASTCIRVNGLSPDVAALAQPMSIAVHAAKRARLARDEHVVVLGVGGIGAFITHVAASVGAKVVACDMDPDRLEVAHRLGAEHTIEIFSDTNLNAELADTGLQFDLIFEATGSNQGLAAVVDALVPGTRLVVAGIQKERAGLDLRRLTLSEHEIIGTNALDIPSDLPAAVELLAKGDGIWSDAAPVVSSLEQLVDADLGSTYRPRPIKTLASPLLASDRPSRMT